ncbi:HYC_CC_PP family protein [Chryseolinea lacunae]|uniref:Uncharacterized protein n=1 Tax=Chryseolinea lacunae TaxID=2801331 RepID=A0ABS1L144_9BACT|nr:hypothetical protein [Chryseolinea lacunae]MBL0745247.1 hypothetical protein [Chryseolinea lacunae]
MKAIRSIAAIAFSLLVLVSSSSFVVGIHWCGGHINSVAVLSKAEACGMEQNVPPCHRHMKASCCQDENIVHEGQGFKLSHNDHHIGHAPLLSIGQPLVLLAEIIPSSPVAITPFRNYDPPLRSSDILVDVQVFRI